MNTRTTVLFTLSAAASLSAILVAATATPAAAPAAPALLKQRMAIADGAIVRRVDGATEEGGICRADLSAAFAGTALRVEAVRAYGYAGRPAGEAKPRFTLVASGADGQSRQIDMPIVIDLPLAHAGMGVAYFMAQIAKPMTLPAGAALTASAAMPVADGQRLSCRFQVEARPVPSSVVG